MISMSPDLSADFQAIKDDIAAKAVATQTEIANKAIATQNLVSAENDATQGTLAGIGTSGELDANTINVNAHTSTKKNELTAENTANKDEIKASINAISVLLMPQIQTDSWDDVRLKANNTFYGANENAFWSYAGSTVYDKQGYETAVLEAVANTAEQELMNVTGQGVLTNVVSPSLSVSGIMTIKVAVDGVEYIFTSLPMAPEDDRLCIGGFAMWSPTITDSDGVGVGSANDVGFHNTPRLTLPTPNQVMQRGNIGMVFQESCVVTIQGSVNISSTIAVKNAYAGWVTSIPKGL